MKEMLMINIFLFVLIIANLIGLLYSQVKKLKKIFFSFIFHVPENPAFDTNEKPYLASHLG